MFKNATFSTPPTMFPMGLELSIVARIIFQFLNRIHLKRKGRDRVSWFQRYIFFIGEFGVYTLSNPISRLGVPTIVIHCAWLSITHVSLIKCAILGDKNMQTPPFSGTLI